ncbi:MULTISPECIES: DUF2806 domain-containing protein [unclassified Pantoea]|uniref:DUF2806 domain-containing protein n=1 Tax=unclassified Pantoea TaxID=2630326 RepID=UPI001231B8A6|nr:MULTISPECIES: DUF2806 domain-containing protein [unclassified Pantoea]KAA5971980.1 DUF2806 domain-containing protein [Pantoea sp. M_6]KAA5977250.1 DUF2806 domain-containing protein [Pantoea sp. M_8]KAA5993444.1 DUF2806 domain-containing protein [Pantoea sp. M_10]
MDIKDLAGLSKPLTKLIEVVSSGVGAVSKPYLIRKEAEAKVEEIQMISAALKKAADESGLPIIYKKGDIEMWQRPEDGTLNFNEVSQEENIESRLDYLNRKKQGNLEKVTTYAARELISEELVSEKAVDEDWITSFFNNAENITSDSMQQLWGRILAGEVKEPGTYSLRTIDFVRTLSQADAKIIQKVSPLIITFNGISCLPFDDLDWKRKNRSINVAEMLDLSGLGVLHESDMHLKLFTSLDVHEEHFFQGEHVLEIKRGSVSSEILLPAKIVTTIGEEILSLLPPPDDLEYLKIVGDVLIKKGAEIRFGQVIERFEDGRIQYQYL